MTFCISTQVGCAMACAFCLTGKMGLVRNLTAGEIVGQVRVLADALGMRDKPFNIVLMGMGEPLHNYDETMKALRILADEHGFACRRGGSRCRPSACCRRSSGWRSEPVMPNLAISLHAPTDVQRGELVPINRKYGVSRHHRGVQAVPAEAAQPHHVRVRAAGRRERLAGGCAAARQAAGRREIEGEPDSAERRRRAFRSSGRRTQAIDRFAQILADHGRDRFGAEEPRPRHPRRVRSVDRRGPETITRPAARDARVRQLSNR